MHSTLLTIIWRRKLSILLLASILFLIGLWSWAFFNTAYSSETKGKLFSIKSFELDKGEKPEYLLQKLISQANSVIQKQQQQQHHYSHQQDQHANDEEHQQGGSDHNGALSRLGLDSIVGNPLTGRTSGVRFIKPTGLQSSLAKFKASSDTAVAGVGVESFLFEGERLRMLQSQQQQRSLRDEVSDRKKATQAERQSQYERDLQRMGIPIIAGIGPGGPAPPNQRLVHLDLKGAPPKLSFLKKLLPVLKTLGATGLLMEYEDMFPYSGTIETIAASNAYNRDELREFLESAARHGMSVMPLVQTFGHLEFALKLQGFEHMREVPESPQSICPSQKFSMSFIEEMITQMIEFHLRHQPKIQRGNSTSVDGVLLNFTHIHIGCDEVYRMGECPKCILKPRNELFLNHVTTIASFIRAKWPYLKVVIWDDMLRDMTLSDMQNSQIGKYVEPMIWVYANDIYKFIQPHLWDKYSRVFPTAWAASAFKGAFGETLMMPTVQKHLENNLRWLAVIAKEGGRFSKGFRGMALTGWQRYDHFSVLCELLPTAMPSLFTTLSTVSRGYFSADPKDNVILSILECPNRPDSRRSGRPWLELQGSHQNHIFLICTYPGSLVFKHITLLNEKLTETRNFLTSIKSKSAWMSGYNIRHNFSSPNRVREITANIPKIIEDLTLFAKESNHVMKDIFEENTIGEFIEQNIYPLIIELREHNENGKKLMMTRTWQRRPLPYERDIINLELLRHENKRESDNKN